MGNLFPALSTVVSTYSPMTSLQVFEAATAPKSGNNTAGTSVWASQNSLNDVAVRIAHIGILHWRVWAPLAYLVNPDGEGDGEENMGLSGQEKVDGDVDVDSDGDRSQMSGAGEAISQDSTSESSTMS